MSVDQTFLGWDKPVVHLVTDYLLCDLDTVPIDLSDTLIVVPTRQAGRRLRERLAMACAQNDMALLSPEIVLPNYFLAPEPAPSDLASAAAVTCIWSQILRTVSVRRCKGLFPVGVPTQDLSWATSTGALIQDLRERLLEGRLSIGDVVHRFGQELAEPERWSDLAWLEQQYLERVAQLDLRDPCRFSLDYVSETSIPPRISRVVLASVPDPEPLVLHALEHLSEKVPVEILVHAPSELSVCFDAWGRPSTAHWCAHEIAIPDTTRNLVLAGNPNHQGRTVMEILQEERHTGAPDTAIGVPDARLTPVLRAALAEKGLSGHDPAGKPLTEHPLYHLLDALRSWLNEGAYKGMSALLRHPDVLRMFDHRHDIPSDQLLEQLDRFQNRHLPLDFEEIHERLIRPAAKKRDDYDKLREAVIVLRSIQNTFAELDFYDALKQTLQSVYDVRRINHLAPKDALFEDAAGKVMQVMEGIPSSLTAALGLDARDMFDLLLHACARQRIYPERGGAEIDLEGWLELPWNDAPLLIVAGMNDGFVPDGRVDDVFLPNNMLKQLGLRHDEDREARDAYLMQSLIACRSQMGRAVFVVGKTSAAGDPIKPSRLLFHCSDEDLLERADKLFGDAEGGHESYAPTFSFKLDLGQVSGAQPIEHMHVTSFRDYLTCPFRFYLDKVLEMEELTDTKTEMDAGDFGSLVHYAFQEMAAGTMRHADDEHELAAFLQDAAERWVFARFGRNRPLQVDIQLHAAQQRLVAAAQHQVQLSREGWEIIAVELDCAWSIGGLPVQGRIDRVDRHRDSGAIRILDYKSADQGHGPVKQHVGHLVDDTPDYAVVTLDGKRRRWLDLQLPLYALMLQAHEEFGAVHELAYFSLPKAVSGAGVVRWEGFDDALLQQAQTCAEGVVEAICDRRFWPPSQHVRFDPFERLASGSMRAACEPTKAMRHQPGARS